MTASIEKRFPNKHVETIPNACDLELFGKPTPTAARSAPEFLNASEKEPLIIYAGTFGAANGVDYAVRIADELSRIAPHIRTLLIGSGKYFADVRQLAHERGLLDKSVRVETQVSKADVARIFQSADLALSLFIDLPILATNSANKFFDAIASGTPVAINYGGWQAELIRSAECGLVLPPNDAAKAAQQIADFLSDPARITDAGERARRLAETTFDRNVLVDKLAVLLEGIHRKATAFGSE
jgi:glycosyltransferase involved in cell wall biosynthesis